MGLAGTKTRRKLALDPNNTKWSRDETTFGQKILRSHGWEPGQFLGAQNSSHADLHSAASAAPIRITLKDDTLGLGAKVRQKQSDECTGLDVFKDLLGRLNGKSEDTIKKEQTIRSEIKTSLYVERKFGLMRFVKGGLLVGDQMSDLLKEEEPVKDEQVKEESKDQIPLAQVPSQGDDESSKPKKEKKSKKRKAEESESPEESEVKEKKKKKKRTKEEPAEESAASSSSHEDDRKAKKEKKKSKKSRAEETPAGDDEEKSKSKGKSKKDKKRKSDAVDEADNVPEETSDSKKKQKKEKKRKQRDTSDTPSEEATPTGATMTSTPAPSGTATPAVSGTSTPQYLSTRHLVRSRNIASKRKALDATALAQIFMVKPV